MQMEKLVSIQPSISEPQKQRKGNKSSADPTASLLVEHPPTAQAHRQAGPASLSSQLSCPPAPHRTSHAPLRNLPLENHFTQGHYQKAF